MQGRYHAFVDVGLPSKLSNEEIFDVPYSDFRYFIQARHDILPITTAESSIND
jgi:hypothetical protein